MSRARPLRKTISHLLPSNNMPTYTGTPSEDELHGVGEVVSFRQEPCKVLSVWYPTPDNAHRYSYDLVGRESGKMYYRVPHSLLIHS